MSGSIAIIGASNSETANVADNALLVRPHSAFDQAIADGNAYSWSSLTYNYAAIDTILGVENNSTSLSLYIEDIWVNGDTATEVVIHTNSGITMAGTNAVVGVNLNRGSSNVASATAYDDETGNTASAAYTGRVGTGRIGADRTLYVHVGGAIILPYDWMIGVDLTTVGTAANVTIHGYFK
jgi:hypothetical protein